VGFTTTFWLPLVVINSLSLGGTVATISSSSICRFWEELITREASAIKSAVASIDSIKNKLIDKNELIINFKNNFTFLNFNA
jgi:hypothetical protein